MLDWRNRRTDRETGGANAVACSSAFTLIELLVVIAVISILAALLLPTLGRAKAEGRMTVCKNHLHEMGIALRLYVDDSGIYPEDQVGPAWFTAIQPYYQLNWTNPAYHCPEYTGTVSWPNSGWFGGSYAYNTMGIEPPTYGPGVNLGLAGPDWWGGVMNTPRKESDVVASSEMYAILDTAEVYPNYVATNIFSLSGETMLGTGWTGFDYAGCAIKVNTIGFNDEGPPPYSAPSISAAQPQQHNGVRNVLFCDGHVASVRVSDLLDPRKTALNWNFDHQPHMELWSLYP
jgi:prepilin-type N-terminal cleavage/methylation domain-containing protein/prepilin-type processing-associated H-X9-DG protein